MVRTQIQLTDDQARALKALAHRRRISMAELIRSGVDRLLQSHNEPSDDERRRRAVAAIGRHASRRADVSSRHDAHLASFYR